MAGSYEHVLSGWYLVENMGDAAEAVEQLFWLVERGIGKAEARRLLKEEFYPMCRGEIPETRLFRRVRRLMEEEG